MQVSKSKRALVGLSFVVVLSGCAEWQSAGSLTAPDGATVAQVEVALAGAPAGNRTRVVLKNEARGGLLAPGNVVEADNAIVGFTRLHWSDADHLRVTLCEATSFKVSAENLRDPPFIDVGRSDGEGVTNAVWVEVVNLAYSETEKRCVRRQPGVR